MEPSRVMVLAEILEKELTLGIVPDRLVIEAHLEFLLYEVEQIILRFVQYSIECDLCEGMMIAKGILEGIQELKQGSRQDG